MTDNPGPLVTVVRNDEAAPPEDVLGLLVWSSHREHHAVSVDYAELFRMIEAEQK